MRDSNVHILDSLEKLAKHEGEWKQVLSCSTVKKIFQTWEWNHAWANTFIGKGRRLFVLFLYDKKNIICIAPWYINTIRYGPFRLKRIEFLGTPEAGSDYLDVIVRSGKEKEASRRLFQFLMKDVAAQWDCLSFHGLPANSVFFHNFIGEFQREGKYIQVAQGSYCPTVNLPETREMFLSSLRPHRRRQYNRHLRIIKNQGDVSYAITQDLQQNGLLRHFMSFYGECWGKTCDEYTRFLGNLISLEESKKWVEMEYMHRDNRYVAAILHLTYNKTKYSYLTAVDKNFNRRVSVGNVLVCLTLQNAIERKLENYNFLRGSEPYKYHWANSGEQLFDISYSKRKLASSLQLATDTVKNFGKIIFR